MTPYAAQGTGRHLDHGGEVVGKTIHIKREQAGLNRQDFAKLTGLSSAGLRRVEDMETMPAVLTQEKICAGFGISLMELIAETDRRSRA